MQTVKRLNETFKPTAYFLELILERQKRAFHGTVAINGVYEGASPLRLHAKGLEIIDTQIDHKPVKTHVEKDEDHLVFDDAIKAGEYHILVEFRGIITDPMHGLYPCYFEVNGEKQELLATQFESHHAREVFPCIDEPEAKAAFNLTLITEPDVTVLSNMPVRTQVSSDNELTTVFETSPRMSSYLLAFVVGNLHAVSGKTKNDVEVNIWATPNQPKSSLDFALDTSIKAIEFFDEYFGVAYPLKKCDHVALPDFSSGAMENWGLITYREICLLVDENTSTSAKEYVATVICHELSHQWFGNLVTMKWWDDLWLNESFATLMEYVSVDALYPDWDIWTTFTAHDGLSSLKRDALPGVQAIKTPVHHPDEISSLFDPSIVYAKGARILNMLYHFIGEEQFKKGLVAYFKKFAYKNTSGEDLWQCLSSKETNVAEFMHFWIETPGYPLLNVSQTPDKLVLKQKHLLLGETEDDTTIWPVPLFASQPIGLEVLTKNSQNLSPVKNFLRFNQNAAGHYMVHYANPEHRHFVEAEIKHGRLNASERLAVLNDHLMLAQANQASITESLELLCSFKNESNDSVWSVIAHICNETKRLVENDQKLEEKFKKFIEILIDPSIKRLGWYERPTDTSNEIKLRAIIIGLGVYAEQDVIIQNALKDYQTLPLDKLPAETRSAILVAAIKNYDDAFDTLLDIYPKTKSAELQQDLISAMSASRNPDKIALLLNSVSNAAIVRPQDVDRWLIYMLRSKYARQQTWGWLKSHWDWIELKFKSDKSYDNYPRYAAGCFSTPALLKEYKDFFEPLKKEAALKRNITLGIIDITARIHWLERDVPNLRKFLASF